MLWVLLWTLWTFQGYNRVHAGDFRKLDNEEFVTELVAETLPSWSEGCATRPSLSLVTSFDANSPKLPHCSDESYIELTWAVGKISGCIGWDAGSVPHLKWTNPFLPPDSGNTHCQMFVRLQDPCQLLCWDPHSEGKLTLAAWRNLGLEKGPPGRMRRMSKGGWQSGCSGRSLECVLQTMLSYQAG